MRSTNPREVGFIFREYARRIHTKAVPSDPNFIRISVACGKVRLLLKESFRTTFSNFVILTDRGVVRTELPFLHPLLL